MSEYLTTKELAELLRIKERKVYDLAASGQIPCSKAMGKLLFPRDRIEAWIASHASGPDASLPRQAAIERPSVMLGSHDPLLDWALRESQSGIATYFDGSGDGLRRFAAGEGVAAGTHMFDADARDWNTPQVLGDCARQPIVVVEWAKRQRGLILASEIAATVSGLADAAALTFAARQADAGAQRLFEALVADAGIATDRLDVTTIARSETDAALAVAQGKAQACFGLQTIATQFKLAFVHVIEERFDLVVDRRCWFEPPMQKLVRFCASDAFRTHAQEMSGYTVANFGVVHYNAP